MVFNCSVAHSQGADILDLSQIAPYRVGYDGMQGRDPIRLVRLGGTKA
jgi:hypothetical protein